MKVVIVAAGLALLGFARAQTLEIGEVDLFGQTGLNEKAIRANLPPLVGQKIAIEDLGDTRTKISEAIKRTIGKEPTAIEFTSFDIHGKTMLYIGLPGPTVNTPHYRPIPKQIAKLPRAGLAIYKQFIDRLMHSKPGDDLSEDDSKGYALTRQPELHAIQLRMRDYAINQGPRIAQVLRSSRNNEQRVAAAMLLGYAKTSPSQIDDLEDAATDPEEEVRNNAIRALVVRASADPKQIAKSTKLVPIAAALCSGQFSDRNKSSWLFSVLTTSRDPQLLAMLRRQALPGLIEVARWTDPPHAQSAQFILGRIGGIEEARLAKLVQAGDIELIIEAARRWR